MRMNQPTANEPMTKDRKKSLGKLFAYCQGYKTLVVVAMILALVTSIGTLVGPGQLSKITDIILSTMGGTVDLQSIYNIGIVLIIIYVVSLLCGYFQGFIMTTVTQKITKKLRGDI